jgi:hypothetical protein
VAGRKPALPVRKNWTAEQMPDRNRILKEMANLEHALNNLRAIVSKKKKE